MNYYLFQLNEDTATQILRHIDAGNDMLSLPFRNHRAESGPGDQVILWVQGADAFAFAVGEITGPETLTEHARSYREPERGNAPRPAFPVRFDGILDRNVHRSELKAQLCFVDFPFREANMRNPFQLTREQYDALFDLAELVNQR